MAISSHKGSRMAPRLIPHEYLLVTKFWTEFEHFRMSGSIICTQLFLSLTRCFKGTSFFVFFLAFFLLYIEPEMAAGGRFGERFKMRAERPFWRELFVIIWPMQTLSSVPVFLDNAEPSLRNCVRASLCQPLTEFATIGTNSMPCWWHRSAVPRILFSKANRRE